MASLYLHIPFCERKCEYCDFYSVETVAGMKEFLGALEREFAFSSGARKGESFDTVFFGGGTPSLLDPGQLERVMAALGAAFSVVPGAETTVETNPGTVSRTKLERYRAAGVNRLSIGIQSFHDDELAFLGRIHTSEQALRCFADARHAGFDNISIDLMYALPGQTVERWDANLRRAIDLRPEHISAYSLIVEDYTPLARKVKIGAVVPAAVEQEAALFERTMELLADAGYEHYEVSNYALPGFRSRHNDNYWSHGNYLGFGPSAHSFWKADGAPEGRRWWNISSVSRYCAELEMVRMPVASDETVGRKELLNERIFLGLRSDGLDLAALRTEFGFDLEARQPAILKQLVEDRMVSLRSDLLRLTPRGYLLCDELSCRLIP